MSNGNETTSVLWIIAAIIGLGVAILLFDLQNRREREDNARRAIERQRENNPLW